MDILLGSRTYKDNGEANRATLVQNYKGDDLELDELCEHPLCLEPATDLCAVCEPAPGRDVGSFFRTEVEDVERAARDAVEPGVDPLIDGPVPSPSEWLVGPPLAPGVDESSSESDDDSDNMSVVNEDMRRASPVPSGIAEAGSDTRSDLGVSDDSEAAHPFGSDSRF
jgi:hypothetical protein